MAVLQRKATAGDYDWISPDGSGVADLDDLENVNITTPSDGQVLTYDNTNSEWKNADATGGHTIKNSSGTSLTQRNTMQFKTPFSSADNSTSQTTEISLQKLSTGEMDDVVTPLPSSQVVAKDLDDLDDVDITTPSNGQVLAYNSTTNKWENTAGGSGGGGHTIEDASGTELTQRDVLKVSTPLTATDDSTNEETVLGVDSGIDFTGFTPPSSPSEGSNSHYCVCSTAASTIGKKATAFDGDFTIETGTKVYVAFSYKNSATSPTLQIGESEAIAIKGYGTTKPSSWWVGGDVVQFIYDGTNWIMQPTQGQISNLSSALTDVVELKTATGTMGSWNGSVCQAEITPPSEYTESNCTIVSVTIKETAGTTYYLLGSKLMQVHWNIANQKIYVTGYDSWFAGTTAKVLLAKIT